MEEMEELKVMPEQVVGPLRKLPARFVENYIHWTQLERIGNYCFLSGQSVSGGPTLYASEPIHVDRDNVEYILSPMNWNSFGDPTHGKSDPPPIQYSKDRMYKVFKDSIAYNEQAIARRTRIAEEEVLIRLDRNLLVKKVKDLRELQTHLQTELREMNLASETINGILKNARAKVVLHELNQIETTLKYAFPIF
jgi:flagellar biosynthesis regulator FlaF